MMTTNDKDKESCDIARPFFLNLNRSNEQPSDLQPGKLYEKALFIYTLINNPKKVFDLGKEISLGDKWDDLVLKEYENNQTKYTFIQIKLINDSNDERNFINSDVLLGKRKISLKENDYMLQKYLLSYLRINDQLNSRGNNSKIKKLIIFTNAHLDENELNKNVGNVVHLKTLNEVDIIPNTNKDSTNNKNVSYKISKVNKHFFREMKVNLKSDFTKLVEELAVYATNSKPKTMTLDEDYFAYYHKSLFDEMILAVTEQQQGNKFIKIGKFTENFINRQELSSRAKNLRDKLSDIVYKKGISEQELRKNMKAAEWTVSNDFDVNKTKEFAYLPNYDISDKDIKDFFDCLEIRAKQLAVKDLLSMISNYQIKKTFLNYYDTDPKLVEFLIDEFLKSWDSKTPAAETWILNYDRSIFIDKLTTKISKPKAVHKTLEYIQFLDKICKIYDLYYNDCCLFDKVQLKNTFIAIRTTSNILTAAKMIQSLNKMKRQDIFFIDFNNVLQHEEILKLVDAFWSDEFNLIIMSYTRVVDDTICKELFIKLTKILKENGKKKIIFITTIKEDPLLKYFASLSGYKEYCDKQFGLQYFRSPSKILSHEIFVQDQSMRLIDFIDNTQTNNNLIDASVIEDFINNKKIMIGSKETEVSDLKGAYFDLVEDVHVDTFVDSIIHQSSDIFVINGIPGCNSEKKFFKYLNIGILEGDNSRTNSIIKYIEILNQNDVNKPMNKKIQICNFVLKKESFKQICMNNSKKKCFWITIDSSDTCKFTLEQIYNPDFYVTGKRFNNKVMIAKTVKIMLVCMDPPDTFIISLENINDFENWLQLADNRDKEQFKLNCAINKIRFVESTNIGKIMLQEMLENDPFITCHLVEFKQNQLIWNKTYGSFRNLSKFRVRNCENTKLLLEEDSLIKEIKDEKAVIISGDPGIGKSTALVKLLESKYTSNSGTKESIIQSHWLIRVNLKDNLFLLKDINTDSDKVIDINVIVNFLSQVDANLKCDFAKTLLNIALTKKQFKKPILILFDGFDEVLDEVERHKLIRLFCSIKSETNAKFWITTREHLESTLENALSNFAIKLEKMNDKQIREFIQKYLKNYLNLIISHEDLNNIFCTRPETKGNTKIDIYTNTFTSIMQNLFQDDIAKFIGTPLQLFLMLEGSARHFKDWIKDGNELTQDFSYLGTDIWEVYEKFVERKYKTYFEKYKIQERLKKEQEQATFDGYHKSLATSLMFKSVVNKDLENFKDMVLLVGIVKCYESGIEFIHTTFREYYAAQEVISWIVEWDNNRSSCHLTNFHKQKFFLQECLVLSEYKMVREFLNIKLLKESYENIKFEEIHYNKNILFVATIENHIGIMSFILRNIAKANVNAYSVRPILHVAVDYGYLDMIKYLVENNANVNSKDINDEGTSVLHKLAKFRNTALIKFFVKYGANVNAEDMYSSTVLHNAVTSNLDMVKCLIDNGAYINARDSLGTSVLHTAILSDKLCIVKYLIKSGAEIDTNDKKGESTLHGAIKYSNLDMVEILIANGVNVNRKDKQNKSVLHYAVEIDNYSIVQFLISKHADVNAKDDNGKSVLHSASKCLNMNIVKSLVENGADVNAKDISNNSVLHEAAKCLNLEMVKYLVTQGSNVKAINKEQKSILHSASEFNFHDLYLFAVLQNKRSSPVKEKVRKTCLHDSYKIVDFLASEGADVNYKDKNGKPVLQSAIESNNLDMVTFLLNNGADVNIKDNNDKSILMSAVESSNLQIVELLIEYGANVNAMDKNNKSVLQIAAKSDNFEFVELLISKGANVNSKDLNNKSVLHSAVKVLNLKMLKFLVANGANVNAKDRNNESVLFTFVLFHLKFLTYECKKELYKKHICIITKIVEFLVSKEADINVTNIHGRSALQLAIYFNNLDVAKLLIKNGAKFNSKCKENELVLLSAVASNNLNLVKLLEVCSIDFNVKDTEGKSVLHKAAESGNLDIVEFLIAKGLDIHAKDHERKTVLHAAVDFDVVKYLVMSGADINAQDKYGKTVLHYTKLDFPTIQFLVKAGANVMAKDINNRSVLHYAVADWDLEIVKFLIAAGVPVNAKDKSGTPVLHSATEREQWYIVQFLVEMGADVNAVDGDQTSALHKASRFGNLDIVNFFVENNANVNTKDNNNSTILHSAVESNNLKLVEFLVEKGLDVNAKDKHDKSVLHVASASGNMDVVKFLLAKGAHFKIYDDEGKSILHYAVTSWNLKLVKYFVKIGANVNSVDENGRSTLHSAAENKRRDIVEYLVQMGVNVNSVDNNGRSVLHVAIKSGDFKIVKFLLKQSADGKAKDTSGLSVLHSAIKLGNIAIVELILAKDPDVDANDENNESVLLSAAESGDLDIVKLLLQKGAKSNTKDNQGKSILHYAVSYNLEIVKFFVTTGADVNAKDNHGKSVLQTAIEAQRQFMVKYLVQVGADVNAFDNDYKTVLHSASKFSDLEIVNFLVENAADIYAKDLNSMTVLHLAAEAGNIDIVEFLVEKGLDVNAKDKKNKSVLHLASESGNFDLVKYLVLKGAHANVKDNEGKSVLHTASKPFDLDIVKFLVQVGFDIIAEDNNGNTILHEAVYSYDLGLVKFLINSGVNIRAANKEKITVLHNAVNARHLNMVKCLVDAGADVNVFNKKGESVLHIAVDLDIVEYLVMSAADVNAKDNNGTSVLHSAVISSNVEKVEYLVAKGADVNTKDNNNISILNSAIALGNLNIIHSLVAKGANVL